MSIVNDEFGKAELKYHLKMFIRILYDSRTDLNDIEKWYRFEIITDPEHKKNYVDLINKGYKVIRVQFEEIGKTEDLAEVYYVAKMKKK